MSEESTTPSVHAVAGDAVVARIIPGHIEYYPGEQPFPPPQAFALSSADKASDRPSLSVFDTARASVWQAKAFYPSPNPACCLGVDAVRAIAGGRLDVVRQPLADPRPGADGHCGLTGLGRADGEPRAVIRNLLFDLADVADYCKGEAPGDT